MVLAPVGAGGGPGMPGADGGDEARGGAGAEGGGGAVGGPDRRAGGGAAGEFGEVGAEAPPIGAVVGPAADKGAVASIGSVTREGGIGPVVGIPAIEAVDGPPEGIGAVDPFGATGPDSSACALKLMRTVSFFKGTVEVLTEGLGGS